MQRDAEDAHWLEGRPPGQLWLAPAGAEPFAIEPHRPARLLRTFVPE